MIKLFSFLMVVCVACNTVHKTSVSTVAKTDSTAVHRTDSAEVKKTDSVAIKTESGGFERETVYVYDTVYQVVAGDTVLKYVPRIVKVYEKGNYNKAEMSSRSTYDSGGVRQTDSVVKRSEVKTVAKEKTSKRFPTMMVVGGLLALAIFLAFIFITRKK